MANLIGESTDAAVAAVIGENTNGGDGVTGVSNSGDGVHGISTSARGVLAESDSNYGLRAKSRTFAGVRGSSIESRGVEGQSTNSDGVVGNSLGAGAGVIGVSESGTGVEGKSTSGRGMVAESDTNFGLRATSRTTAGVRGSSIEGRGVEGQSTNSDGVVGNTDAGAGVIGISNKGIGVHGKGGRLAGLFEGDVEVTGDIRLANADCAEDFDVAGVVKVEPGTVMVLGNEGTLFESQQAYDKRVAGVISGAGDYKPGIVLDKRQTQGNRQPIALMGKVFCKVDAQFGAIEVGDLLTTSPTPGHAMKTNDPFKAFGAVIGKALRPLTEGQGLIPILIALQ